MNGPVVLSPARRSAPQAIELVAKVCEIILCLSIPPAVAQQLEPEAQNIIREFLIWRDNGGYVGGEAQ